MNVCTDCAKQYTYIRLTGCTTTRCASCCSNQRRFKLKDKIIAHMGGSCARCGYGKCPQALHTHHLDPTQKDFNISGRHCQRWAVIEEELKKCILLCANCHAEEHAKLTHARRESKRSDLINQEMKVQILPRVPKHGRATDYAQGCRCAPCKKAHADRLKDYRAKLKS